jgi:hypothetical protein
VRWSWIMVSLLGLAVTALGTLWFLQGSDLLHIEPILCATDCDPVGGHQPAWQLAGLAAVLAGMLATTLALRKLRR